MPPINESGVIVNGEAANDNDNAPAAPPRKFTFPSHQFHMVNLAKMCQENKEYTDCVIRVGEEELRAHRLVLGSVSPFLKLVFADIPSSLAEATILVPGVKKGVVKALLDFFYTGQMTVDRQDTSDLQLLIDTLQIDPGLITVDAVQKEDHKDDDDHHNSEQLPTSASTSSSSSSSSTTEESTNGISSRKRKASSKEEASEEAEAKKLHTTNADDDSAEN